MCTGKKCEKPFVNTTRKRDTDERIDDLENSIATIINIMEKTNKGFDMHTDLIEKMEQRIDELENQ